MERTYLAEARTPSGETSLKYFSGKYKKKQFSTRNKNRGKN
jgi:hypothetical protein